MYPGDFLLTRALKKVCTLIPVTKAAMDMMWSNKGIFPPAPNNLFEI